MKSEILVVLNKDEDTISFVSTKTGETIKKIVSDHNPHEVVVAPNHKTTYVSCSLGNTIDVIDNETLEITHRIKHPKFDFPHGVGMTQSNRLFCASTYSACVFEIDTDKNEVVNVVETGEVHSHMIALTPDEKIIYVPNIGSDSISVLDGDSLSVLSVIGVGRGPEGVAVHPNGKWLYVANQDDNNLLIIDTQTHEVLWKRRLGTCPIRVVFSPDGKYALIPNRESDDLSIIMTEQEINGMTRPWEIKRVPVGKWPGGTVFSKDGTKAYVANNKTNDISVIDMLTLKEVNRFDVGIHPDGMAIIF